MARALKVSMAVVLAAAIALSLASCGDNQGRTVASTTATRPRVATSPAAGGSIVYEKEGRAGTQLFRARADGTGEHQLTHVDGDALRPDWSPDGRRIVFEIDHQQTGCSIALLNADGTGLTDLGVRGDHDHCDNGPAFTPDGTRIVFVAYDGIKDIERVAIMDVDGRQRHRIPTPWRTGVGTPHMSPDGKWIAFVRLAGKDNALDSLFVMRPDGSRRHRLTPASWSIPSKFDWSPDGKLIVLTTHGHFVRPGESANVVTIHPDGTIATRITHFTGAKNNAFNGSFSPDGKKIIVRLERGETYSLATVDPDGRNLRALSMFGPDRPRAIDWGTR